jgi:hypothetical protein
VLPPIELSSPRVVGHTPSSAAISLGNSVHAVLQRSAFNSLNQRYRVDGCLELRKSVRSPPCVGRESASISCIPVSKSFPHISSPLPDKEKFLYMEPSKLLISWNLRFISFPSSTLAHWYLLSVDHDKSCDSANQWPHCSPRAVDSVALDSSSVGAAAAAFDAAL